MPYIRSFDEIVDAAIRAKVEGLTHVEMTPDELVAIRSNERYWSTAKISTDPLCETGEMFYNMPVRVVDRREAV